LILLIFLLGPFTYSRAQITISKVVLTYSKGHSSWNKPGIYSRSEQIEISPATKGDYRLTSYYRVNHSAGSDGKTFIKDTLSISVKRIPLVGRHKFENWLSQLNTQKENFTASFVKPHLSNITMKDISDVAKAIEEDLFFDRDFKEERQKVVRKIVNFYNLDSFLLLTRANTENEMAVTDNWNRLRIEVIKGADTTVYLSQFFAPLGQPILVFEHKDFTTHKQVYNLEVNTYAQEFLPKESQVYKALDLNNIKEPYIRWCLDKYF
jgi:hypothetical protein